ncbi:MAG: glycosyltransferase family 2 protein, partial [Terriglobales bacterium]
MSPCSVIVPTLNAAERLPRLLERLWAQQPPPAEILIIDSASRDDTVAQAARFHCRIHGIERAAFDHGGTRHLGLSLTSSRYAVFLTQDALPCDTGFLAALLAPLEAGCAAAYARQMPYPGASPLEQFQRAFNYPPCSYVRRAADLERMGLKAAFFSNVASAVDREAYGAVGGFPSGVVFNEDMMLACRLLRAGYQIAYAAEARVFHSHSYALSQQFRRYFDIGASHFQGDASLRGLASSQEGSRFAWCQMRALLRQRAWRWLPRGFAELAVKWLAFQLGHN